MVKVIKILLFVFEGLAMLLFVVLVGSICLYIMTADSPSVVDSRYVAKTLAYVLIFILLIIIITTQWIKRIK